MSNFFLKNFTSCQFFQRFFLCVLHFQKNFSPIKYSKKYFSSCQFFFKFSLHVSFSKEFSSAHQIFQRTFFGNMSNFRKYFAPPLTQQVIVKYLIIKCGVQFLFSIKFFSIIQKLFLFNVLLLIIRNTEGENNVFRIVCFVKHFENYKTVRKMGNMERKIFQRYKTRKIYPPPFISVGCR